MTARVIAALYQVLLLDHGRNPRRFGPLAGCQLSRTPGTTRSAATPSRSRCALAADCIADVRFEGAGCAIPMASASLMSDAKHTAGLRGQGSPGRRRPLLRPGLRRPGRRAGRPAGRRRARPARRLRRRHPVPRPHRLRPPPLDRAAGRPRRPRPDVLTHCHRPPHPACADAADLSPAGPRWERCTDRTLRGGGHLPVCPLPPGAHRGEGKGEGGGGCGHAPRLKPHPGSRVSLMTLPRRLGWL